MKSSESGGPPPYDPFGNLDPQAQRAIAKERAFAVRMQSGAPWATYGIVAICVVAYLFQQVSPAFDEAGVSQGALVMHGQIWRLWSATFLHGNILHIGSNMWVLVSLGRLVERVVGRQRFLVLYALSGLCGSLFTTFLEPQQAVLGASGAIWGIITAALALAIRPHGLIPPQTASVLRPQLMRLVVLNAVISIAPGISALGHLGGGVAGFVLTISGFITLGAEPSYGEVQESTGWHVAWTAAAIGLTCLMVLSLGVALVASIFFVH